MPCSQVNELMFSMTPATRRKLLRAIDTARLATFWAADGRRGDHEDLGAGQQLGHAHLHVAGAGRHVDEEVVEVVAPVDVLEEVRDAAVEHEAAPHQRRLLVLDQEAHRDDPQQPVADHALVRDHHLACRRARGRRGGPSTPSMRGTEKPQMSASSTPTLQPGGGEGGGQVHGDRRLADAALARRHEHHLGGGGRARCPRGAARR